MPTNGPSAAQHARSDIDGIAGSCKCNRSNFPLEIHCLTRAKAIGPNKTRATAPLYGMEIGFPALVTYSGMASSSITGASTET